MNLSLPRIQARFSLRTKALILLSVVFLLGFAGWVVLVDSMVDGFLKRQQLRMWEQDQAQFGRLATRRQEALELLGVLAAMTRRPFENEAQWLALMADYQVLWAGRYDQHGRLEGEISLWDPGAEGPLRAAVAGLLRGSEASRLVCADGRCYQLVRLSEQCDEKPCAVVLVQDVAVLLGAFYLFTGHDMLLLDRQGRTLVGTHLARNRDLIDTLDAERLTMTPMHLRTTAEGRRLLLVRLDPPAGWESVQLFVLHDVTEMLELFDTLRQRAILLALALWLLALVILLLGISRALEQIDHLSLAVRSLAQQDYGRARSLLVDAPRSLLADELDALIGDSRHLVDEAERLHGELKHLAEYDALTGLMNRRAFAEALDGWLRSSARGSLILVDLNRFKQINDLFGHVAGDLTLQELAARLRRHASRQHGAWQLFRLGGDEFVIWVPGVWVSDTQLRSLAQALAGWFELPTGERVYIESSVGAVHLPGDARSAREVIMRVDSAMYRAKQAEDGTHWRLYDPRLDDREALLRQERELVDWLRQALDEGCFRLVYQPIVRLPSGEVSHYEVLLRLDGPDGAPVSPAQFIPLAERYGLSGRIDEWVLDRALATLSARDDALVLAVNFSAATIQRRDLVTFVQAALHRHEVAPQRLIIELTETAYVSRLMEVRESLAALRQLGIRVALDDFGEGYASFNYLTELPFDFVKIDGRYVRQLGERASYRALIAGLTQIIHAWDSQVVAEFVDSEVVLTELGRIGVDYAQGYLLGRPGPLPDTDGEGAS